MYINDFIFFVHDNTLSIFLKLYILALKCGWYVVNDPVHNFLFSGSEV